MAEEQLPPDADVNLTADAEPGRFAALLPKLKVGGLMVGIVAGECAVAYLFIPTASVTSASAEAIIEGNLDEMEDAARQADEEAREVREVDLERHLITVYQDDTSVTLRIEFQLFGTVLAKDESDFQELLVERKLRVNEQINLTVRNSEFDALTDPGLGLLKRQILEKINRTLGKPYLRSIGFGVYQVIDQ